jgi:hypothetical protein
MPRNGASMLFGSGGGTFLIQQSYSINNSQFAPVVGSSEEITKFSEVRSLIAETMSRIIRRDEDTNGILGTIAIGRSKLAELAGEK